MSDSRYTDADWDNIKREVEKCPFLTISKENRIYLFFERNVTMIIVGTINGEQTVYDLFSGKRYKANRDQIIEYIQRVLLLPAPTYPRNIIKNGYMQGNYHYLRSVWICNEYILVDDKECYRVVTPRELVTICRKTFRYDIHTLEKAFGAK